MSVIYVRTKEGRVARTGPKGRLIPHDEFIPAQHTPYLDRVINVHKDVTVRPEPKQEQAAPVAPAAAEPAPVATKTTK